MQAFSPREIVSELDRFIIGQDDAKKICCYRIKKSMEKATTY